MAIKMLPILAYFAESNVISFPPIETTKKEFPWLDIDIYGILGEWNNPTHFVVKLSNVLWVIDLCEVSVRYSEPLNMTEDEPRDFPADHRFVWFDYVGKDEALLVAVKEHCVEYWPGIRHLLGLPPNGKSD